MFGHYTYLFLNLISVLFPFLLSFDKKVAYYKSWKELFIGIGIVAIFFIVWDIFFTKAGVWSFNPDYIIGIYFWGLPLEEILFFVCVPYASVFIYECYQKYFSFKFSQKLVDLFCQGGGFFLLFLAILYYNKAYTFYNCLFGGLLLLYHHYFAKAQYMSHFIVSYLIHLVPFLIINGFLTAYPVVIYNNDENLGIRIYTIPIEDTVYALTMLLGVVTIMEHLKKKQGKQV
jgi:lycopene cyclase domain-containing protein